MGLFKSIKRGVKSIGNAVGDAFEDVGDFVGDALDNDIVKAAAIAAGAYYLGPAIMGSGAAAAAPAAGTAAAASSTWSLSSAWTGLVDKAFLAGYSPSAVGVAKWAAAGVGKQLATNLAVNTATGMLAGGGKSPMPKMARASTAGNFGPSTQYGTFKSGVTDLGMDPRVAQAMAKVADTNIPSIRGAMNQVRGVGTSGPTIELGSSSLASIGVRGSTSVS